jgi:hypothetical protein
MYLWHSQYSKQWFNHFDRIFYYLLPTANKLIHPPNAKTLHLKIFKILEGFFLSIWFLSHSYLLHSHCSKSPILGWSIYLTTNLLFNLALHLSYCPYVVSDNILWTHMNFIVLFLAYWVFYLLIFCDSGYWRVSGWTWRMNQKVTDAEKPQRVHFWFSTVRSW